MLPGTMTSTTSDLLQSEQVSNSNLTKTPERATLNFVINGSEQANRIAKTHYPE